MDAQKNHLVCFQTPGIGQKLIFKKSITGESFDIFTLKVAYMNQENKTFWKKVPAMSEPNFVKGILKDSFTYKT